MDILKSQILSAELKDTIEICKSKFVLTFPASLPTVKAAAGNILKVGAIRNSHQLPLHELLNNKNLYQPCYCKRRWFCLHTSPN